METPRFTHNKQPVTSVFASNMLAQDATIPIYAEAVGAAKPTDIRATADIPRTVGGFWKRLHRVSPFISNVVLTVNANVGIALVSLMTGPLCARMLGPAGRGELAALQNLYWFVAVLSLLGIPEATLYFIARRKEESGHILASAIFLVLLCFPLFYLVARQIVPVFLAAQSPAVIETAVWYLLGIPLYALITVPLFALRGTNDILRWNILRSVPTVGWLLLLVGLFGLGISSPKTVAIGYLGVLGATLVPTLLIVRKGIKDSFTAQMRWWPRMLKYGIPLAAAAIPFTLNIRLDQMIMAAFLPARSLGLYVVAVSWSGSVLPLLLAIGTVLFPRIANANVSDGGKLLAQGTRVGLFAALVLAAAISIITPVAIPLLFGKAFAGSILVSVILVFAAAILGANTVCEEGLRGLGFTSLIFWGEASGLVVTAMALIFLLRPLGILGAGIASILGYFFTGVVLFSGIRQKTGMSFADILLINNSDLRGVLEKIAALRRLSRPELNRGGIAT